MLPIDHVTVAGASLQPMRAALSAVGIDTVYGGAHRDGATEMALVSFPDGSYLELIAPLPHAAQEIVDAHPWSRFLSGDAGPCAWAVSASDLDAEILRLRSAGVVVSAPISNGRQRPDGVQLEWRTAVCGSGPAGSFFPFVIEDTTLRDLRARPQGVPTNQHYRGIARIVLGVSDLDGAIARFHQAYELTCTLRQVDPAFGADFALLGEAPIVLAQPLDSDSWLADRLERFGEVPCAVVLEPNGSRGERFPLDIHWLDPRVLGWRLGLLNATDAINY
jgi:Glyoxalase-like domain